MDLLFPEKLWHCLTLCNPSKDLFLGKKSNIPILIPIPIRQMNQTGFRSIGEHIKSRTISNPKGNNLTSEFSPITPFDQPFLKICHVLIFGSLLFHLIPFGIIRLWCRTFDGAGIDFHGLESSWFRQHHHSTSFRIDCNQFIRNLLNPVHIWSGEIWSLYSFLDEK